ncbi:DUF7619 domain-containing protein [Chryseobacterium aquaeductus]|nr:T9SS type A sorting domain-containing protein [Chryseobacterium aquaeductus]
MKKIYFLILVLLFPVFHAQLVNISDANFKAKLLAANVTNNKIAKNLSGQWTNVDTNYDGEIQITEALNLKYLDLTTSPPSTNYITNHLGIESFTNLNFLSFNRNQISSVNLSLPNLTDLNVNSNSVTSLNVQNCPNLEILHISYHGFTNLNVQSNSLKNIDIGDNLNPFSINFQNTPNLEIVTMFFAPIVSIDLSNKLFLKKIRLENMDMLTSLNLQGCNTLQEVQLANLYVIPSINLQNLPALTTVYCTNSSNLQSVNVSNSININKLYINNNNIATVDISTLNNLQDFKVNANDLISLNLSNHTLLKYVNCDDNDLTSINLQNTPALENLSCEYNNLQNINLQFSPQLKTLNVGSNYLTSINVSTLQNLISLGVQHNQLQSLDVTHNPLLTSLGCNSNYGLEYLFLKNGSLQANYTNFNDTDYLKYICCDDSQINDYNSAAIYNAGYFPVVVNSYCSFTPGGTFYTIQGNTKYDSNNNGCDINDFNKAFQKFNINSGSVSGISLSNNSGNYSIPVQAGSHTITPVLENPTYFNISPSTFTANFPAQTSPLTQNFCLSANGAHNDLEVVIIPITAASPGFNAKYKVIYKNKGTTTQSGTLVYNYNDNLMNYLSSTLAPTSQSTGILNWNFANLLPFETREITITFTLNTPMQSPPLNGGHILNYTAQINSAVDETPSDNTFTLNQTVVNSFDPNDKTCLEGATITQAKVGDYVHYLIRFENTGTANAQNIVVKDAIDTSKFDINTLQALNGSHSFVTRITNPNTVEFIFENIQLPFADATNDGYVTFKIKTKSTLTLGQSFNNTANIYFDYNFPIVTNTYTTTVQNILGTYEINNDQSEISIYPNPVKDILLIKSKEKIVKAEIYDTAGRIVRSQSVNENSINVSELQKGNYMIRLYMKNNFVFKKFIKN